MDRADQAERAVRQGGLGPPLPVRSRCASRDVRVSRPVARAG
jgi:hypothetical protein